MEEIDVFFCNMLMDNVDCLVIFIYFIGVIEERIIKIIFWNKVCEKLEEIVIFIILNE